MKQWIDLTNEAQHGGTRKVSLECAEEKSSVDRLDLVCSFHNVIRSRKRGPFPQKSDCELDLSADSEKSVVHVRENRLTLARSVPKYSTSSSIHALTLVSRYRHLFQSCRRAQVVSIYYRK